MARNHRNTTTPHFDPNADLRAAEALELAKQSNGHGWEKIAALTGYESRGAAYTSVQRLLKKTLTLQADDYRKLMNERLETLHGEAFKAAMDPSNKSRWFALDRCLAIYERQAKLHGLDVKPDLVGAQNVRREYAYVAN